MTTEVDGLYICPYNQSHMVEWQKLPNHLVRCRKNNPKLLEKIVICPYNQCHHVAREEMEMHLNVCKDHHTFKAVSVKPAPCESLPNRLIPKAHEEEKEHLQYLSYRNAFTSKSTANNMIDTNGSKDAYALKQQQKNLDDLDEWFVE